MHICKHGLQSCMKHAHLTPRKPKCGRHGGHGAGSTHWEERSCLARHSSDWALLKPTCLFWALNSWGSCQSWSDQAMGTCSGEPVHGSLTTLWREKSDVGKSLKMLVYQSHHRVPRSICPRKRKLQVTQVRQLPLRTVMLIWPSTYHTLPWVPK